MTRRRLFGDRHLDGGRVFQISIYQKGNLKLDSTGNSIWQRNYYELIIHNYDEQNRIILSSEAIPVSWMEDYETLRRINDSL